MGGERTEGLGGNIIPKVHRLRKSLTKGEGGPLNRGKGSPSAPRGKKIGARGKENRPFHVWRGRPYYIWEEETEESWSKRRRWTS